MSARGFTLVELLVAAFVLTAVVGAIVALADPLRAAFERLPGSAEVPARARGGLETLAGDLRQAGAGSALGDPRVALSDVTPTVRPLASLEDGSFLEPFRAVRVLVVPPRAAQAELAEAVGAGTTLLRLADGERCAQQDATCGFRVGDRAVLYDHARLEAVRVESVEASDRTLRLAAPLWRGYAAGAALIVAQTVTYGLRGASDGSGRLVRITAAGAEQPIVDSVVQFTVSVLGTTIPPSPGLEEESPPTYGGVAPAAGVADERHAWPPGENCTLARDDEQRAIARLPALGPPALVPLDATLVGDGPWCPDGADPAAFDADLLRLRRIDVRLRVEVSSAAFRGPAGRLFHREGSATRARHWVPDLDLTLSVAPRSQ